MSSTNKKTKSHPLISISRFLLILLVATYLLIWIFSPFVVRHFAHLPLQNMGVSLSKDSLVRYNPFTSTLTVSELTLFDQKKRQTLYVKYAEASIFLHRLLFKQIYVSEFFIEGSEIRLIKDKQSVIVAGFDIAGMTEADKYDSAEQENSDPLLNFALIIPELKLKQIFFDSLIDDTQQTFLLNELLIANTSINQLAQQVSLSIQAKVNEAPLMLHSDIALLAGVGTIDNSFSLDRLELKSLSPMLIDLGVNLSGTFSVNGQSKFRVADKSITVNSEQIVLSLTELELKYAPWVIEGVSDVVTIDNLNATASPDGVIQQLTATVTTELSEGNVGLQTSNNSVLNWDDINLTAGLQLIDTKPSIDIEQINISALNFSEDHSLVESAPILSIGQLSVFNMKYTDDHVNVDTISISNLKTDINFNSDKSIVGLVDISALSLESQDKSSASETITEPAIDSIQTEQVEALPEDSPALTVALEKLQLQGAAYIQIKDQSVSPTFEQKITIEMLKAGPFDSRDSTLKSQFELIAKDDDYLRIIAKGNVMPFAQTLNARLTASITELDLPSVSPYVKQGLGFEMKTGQLDVGVDVEIQEDHIDGETKLFFRGVDMSSADEVEQGTIKEGKAMPLNMALGLLKDDQGNIDLGVPLRGNIAEPSFGIEKFLGLVLKKAAMSQAKRYLMTTFVPYASVVSVAISGAEYLLKVKFEPLFFKTGEVTLSEENQQYLAELVLLMKDKAELQLKTCAIGTYADLDLPASTALNAEQQATLKSMGSKRQNNLKRYLITQNIASSRILYCAPELDTAKEAQARIELKTD